MLSNDSFQEFHGEHQWLFDDGRLLGGKPVPGVGWIFLPRTPVRGQKSREVVKEAKRKKRADDIADGAGGERGLDLAASRSKGRAKKVDRAIAQATEEAVEPKAKIRPRRRSSGLPPAEAVNEPLAFITFIAAHPLGTEVVGTVLEFSSHGAFVHAGGARCYLPLSAMGDPPPRRAREVVGKGEERLFVVQALDPQRRGIELALPGYARIAGGPTEETVEAEIHPTVEPEPKRRRREKAEPAGGERSVDLDRKQGAPTALGAAPNSEARPGAGAGTGEGVGAAAGEGAAPRVGVAAGAGFGAQEGAEAGAAAEAASAGEAAPAKKAPRKRAPAKKTSGVPTDSDPASGAQEPDAAPLGADLAASGRPVSVKKAPAKKTARAGGAVEPAKATSARKAPSPAQKAAPVKKAAAAHKAASVKKSTAQKSPPAQKSAPAQMSAAQKSTAQKSTAQKSAPAKRSGLAKQATPVSKAAAPAKQATASSAAKKAIPGATGAAKSTARTTSRSARSARSAPTAPSAPLAPAAPRSGRALPARRSAGAEKEAAAPMTASAGPGATPEETPSA